MTSFTTAGTGFGVLVAPLSILEGPQLQLLLDAVMRRPASYKDDLRILSSKVGLDSKAVEKQVGQIVAWMIAGGRLPAGLSDDEGARPWALEFAHPVLVGGQVRLRGLPLGAFSYAGTAPADIEELEPGASAEVILMVESFASFNRQIAEAMTGREVVMCKAGFPSRVTVHAVRRLHGACQPPGGARRRAR